MVDSTFGFISEIPSSSFGHHTFLTQAHSGMRSQWRLAHVSPFWGRWILEPFFSGWIESDVHWGLSDLDFEKPMAFSSPEVNSRCLLPLGTADQEGGLPSPGLRRPDWGPRRFGSEFGIGVRDRLKVSRNIGPHSSGQSELT